MCFCHNQVGGGGCFHRSCKLLDQLCQKLCAVTPTWPLIGFPMRFACSQTDDNRNCSWVCVIRPTLATVHRHAISHAAKSGIHPGVLLPFVFNHPHGPLKTFKQIVWAKSHFQCPTSDPMAKESGVKVPALHPDPVREHPFFISDSAHIETSISFEEFSDGKLRDSTPGTPRSDER